MKTLSYKTLEEQGYKGYLLKEAPERMLQFGEGNFLRAFVDYFVDVMNERAGFNTKVVLCQPIAQGLADQINEQEGLYTLYLRGFENGQKVNEKRVISCVSRCLNPYRDYSALADCAGNPELRFIACNTTEAGIVYDPACSFEDKPAASYPGKLTQFLYERYLKYGHEKGRGFIILSCELIDDNGKELKRCVKKYAAQWKLGQDFEDWIERENIFCSTLVDRIVTGYPRGEALELNKLNEYEDSLLDTGEIFGVWVIEGPECVKKEIPFEQAGLPILVTENHKPYKQRKVRILNGAHTSMVLGAYLAGRDIVRDCMHDEVIRRFMNHIIYHEIIPTLTLPKAELEEFAASVTERFQNPFIDHSLLAIALNSTSKWKARVMPSLKGYVEKFHKIPEGLAASLAFYIAFYRGKRLDDSGLYAERNGEEYLIQDDRTVLEFFWRHQGDSAEQLTAAVLKNEELWGEDLTQIQGLEEMVTSSVRVIEEFGAYELMRRC